MNNLAFRRALLAGAAVSVLAPMQAHAQAAAAPDALAEVVVTSTRQVDTVSKVPLSVTAVSQVGLDQQRLVNINDIARAVPSITFRQTGYDQSSTIAIRGVYTSNGAATTGTYLDDTPISKRGFVSGGAGGGNDAPLPHVFDLQRIEILRGPQGTLFGASAEGGAIRFIYPEASLTRYSGYAKAGASVTKDGGPGYEGGVAVGGPIIQDKLGFRVMVEGARIGGYIDHVSPYTGNVFGKNTNWQDRKTFRLAMTWQPTEHLRITPTYYYGEDYRNDVDQFIENVPSFQLNSGYFINRGVSKNGQAYSFPSTYFPGGTFGPYNMYGPYKSPIGRYAASGGDGTLVTSPGSKFLSLPALKVEYDFGGVIVTSNTALVHDVVKAKTWGQNSGTFNYALPLGTYNNAAGGCFSTNATTCVPVAGGPSGVGNPALNPFYPGFADLYFLHESRNERNQISQEVRFSSAPSARPLQWQGGIYYYNSHSNSKVVTSYNESAMSQFYRGFDVVPYITGLTDLSPDGGGNCYSMLVKACYLLPGQTSGVHIYNLSSARFVEKELAAFGEVNYWITTKLKATAGVRVSRFTTEFSSIAVGSSVQSTGALAAGFVATPSHPYPILPGDPLSANITAGRVVEKPVTPKFSLSYQATEDDMVYVTAAKGYRNGGVNSVGALRADCAAQLQSFGLSAVPDTFTSDGVWSYEGGAKVRMFEGRAQINASIFYVDWKEPQLSVRIPCGTSFITNAGHAVSKGIDVDARVRVVKGLTFSLAGGVTDAKYTEDTVAKDPTTGVLSYTVHKGDTLPIPKFQYTIGLDYTHEVYDDWRALFHVDYQYASRFHQTVGPGGVGYNAALYRADSTHFATASASVDKDGLNITLFVKNMANSEDRLSRLKGSGAPVMTYTFRPREIGFTVAKRF